MKLLSDTCLRFPIGVKPSAQLWRHARWRYDSRNYEVSALQAGVTVRNFTQVGSAALRQIWAVRV